MNFPYTCRISDRPHGPHQPTGWHGIDGARFWTIQLYRETKKSGSK